MQESTTIPATKSATPPLETAAAIELKSIHDQSVRAIHGNEFREEHIFVRHHWLWRTLELVPGTISWMAIIIPLILSAFLPVWAATFMIIYTVIWLFRSVRMSVNLYRCTRKVKASLATNWERLISFNDRPEKIDYEIARLQNIIQKNVQNHSAVTHFWENRAIRKLQTQVRGLQNLKNKLQLLTSSGQYKKSKEIVHAIIYVTYKEPYHLVRESVKSYINSVYPSSRIMMVFAGEETDRENAMEISRKIENEFGKKFLHYMTTLHPQNIPGEIRGKSSNATYAAKELKKYLDANEIDYENVIISNFDADTLVHPLYFSELTFKYLTADSRTEKAYQPTHMFHNNIWDVPIITRIVALSCTFWRMAESMDQERYKSFSSRSIGFKTVVDVDYWDPAIIPEDSRQYWTAFHKYDGRHKLIPIFSPIYMDAVLSDTYTKTFKSQYNQLRRWAWGVCDFPFVALNLWYHKKIRTTEKIYQIFEFLKNSLLWATGPILISFMGFMPGLLNPAFRDTVLAYNFPQMMSNILTLASGGIVMCTIISLTLVPYNPKKGFIGTLSLCFQWLLIPVVSIFLSAVPALDAQTRLMFGRYLEYKVTEKARK